MKKAFIFGLMAAALGFTACNSEVDKIFEEKTQKGMELNATVEQPAETRATINDTDAKEWIFKFAENDEVKVTNSAISNTYYTFKKNDTSFKSTDATPTTSATKWYAYFPAESFPLTGQDGTLEAVANLYALAGETTEEVTGDSKLSIAMQPQVAIIKINNQKGTIDIRVKYGIHYITGLIAKNGEAGFQVLTSEPTSFSFLNVNTTGTYYIVVPAGVPLTIVDYKTSGKTELKRTDGLEAGNYYDLEIAASTPDTPSDPEPTPDRTTPDTDPNLIQKLFSVSATKRVQFTKGNLYWDGSGFYFEGEQTIYPNSWHQNHIGHFFWTKSQAASYAETYSDGSNTATDVPFFAESNKDNPTVGDKTGYYALTKDEWYYLINSRSNAENLCKTEVKVGETNCFIIAPDDFNGSLESSYTLDQVNTLGLLCLPVAGRFTSSLDHYTNYGYYWTATPNPDNRYKNYAYVLNLEPTPTFSSYSVKANFVISYLSRSNDRYCIRLVKNPLSSSQ